MFNRIIEGGNFVKQMPRHKVHKFYPKYYADEKR